MLKREYVCCVVAVILLVVPVLAHSQVPSVIHYRGHLDVPGIVPAGTVQRELTFRLYTTEIGGSPIWTETQTLDIYDGNYAVALGTINSVTAGLFAGEFRHLGVQVGGDPELTPRQRIAAVPYSMRAEESANAQEAVHAQEATHAGDADTLGGGQVSADTQGVHITPTSTSETVYVNGSVDATGGLSCDEGMSIGNTMTVGDSGIVGRTTIDTAAVFRINEHDAYNDHSTRDRLRITTMRRQSSGFAITLYHLVVSEDGYLGVNTTNPQGPLDVNGAIYQRGSVLHSDYVFDEDYELESIEEHAERMWERKHLPDVPPRQVDSEGREVLEVGAHRRGMLEELEKAHIYIEQLNTRIRQLEGKIEKLEKRGGGE